MRLSTIKLSGFKSFVDPTTLHLPTNMTGVVGPNGCGKSNIIDAVRCAMLIREEGNLDPVGEEVVSLKPVLTNPVFI